MSSHQSFLNGRPTEFSITKSQTSKTQSVLMTQEPPFDKTLDFNRVVRPNSDDPANHIYSIDAVKMMRLINQDKPHQLAKITLICRPDRRSSNGIAMWDTLFNQSSRHNLNACIMLANADYTPTAMSRVVMSSTFLDYSKPVSRIHLNRIWEGDIIGIGLYDVPTDTSYVLLYEVMSTCVANKNEGPNGDVSTLLSCVNCQMRHAFKISSDGQGVEVPMTDKEYDADKAKPFVEWVINSISDITEAYPWKPHLLPHTPHGGYDRKTIENTLNERMIAIGDENVFTAINGRYEDFEENCRKAYKAAQLQRSLNPNHEPTTKSTGKHKRRTRPQEIMPLVEVYSMGDYFVTTVDIDGEGDIRTVRFNKATMGDRVISEHYLVGSDLVDVNLSEVSSIMMLSNVFTDCDDTPHFRYMSINF